MLLLAFMLVYEFQAKTRKKQKLHGTEVTLTASDHRMRRVLMVNGICMSAYSIVNVLRIRQVAMFYRTDNVAILISAIFTLTMIVNVIGSSTSSSILKKCKNVKTYAVLVMCMGIVGSFMCGVSSNIVIFVTGLIIFNIARAQITMLAYFYSSLLPDVNRKDSCQIEFSSGESLGQVVGNIIGGVISVVLSFAFVQMMAAAFLGLSLLLRLSFNKSELLVNLGKTSDLKSDTPSSFKALIRSDVLLYVVCSLVVSRHVSITVHLVAYVVLCGVVVLFYLLSNSLACMIVSVAAMGFVDGAGYYATNEGFPRNGIACQRPGIRQNGLS